MRGSENGFTWYRYTGTRLRQLRQLLGDEARGQVLRVRGEPLLAVGEGAFEKDRPDLRGLARGHPEPFRRSRVAGEDGGGRSRRDHVAERRDDVVDGVGSHLEAARPHRAALFERAVPDRRPRDRGKAREVGPGRVVEHVPAHGLEHGLGREDLERRRPRGRGCSRRGTGARRCGRSARASGRRGAAGAGPAAAAPRSGRRRRAPTRCRSETTSGGSRGPSRRRGRGPSPTENARGAREERF